MPGNDTKLMQLSEQLDQRFSALLPPLPRPGWTPEQVKQNLLSRSLAAFAVARLADVDNATAAAAVIDDFDDNGVDAVHFDRADCRLILVQSKFRRDGGSPDQADTKKFVDGIRDLCAQKYDRFNDGFQLKLTEIEDALEEPALQLVAVLAWTGNDIADHASRELDDLRIELNQFHADRCSVELLTLDRCHDSLAAEHAPSPINTTLTLENWYQAEAPLRAFYGQISVAQLAQLYQEHHKLLFERNIRYYMGSSGVNDAIAATLRDAPEHLFYLNNGLTAICTRITPRPTAQPAHGEFVIEGLSIVNGAQTVGTISAVAHGADLSASRGRVLITLIELATAPTDFGKTITQARNFQNQVRLVDFAGLDPVQERIRRELAISGIVYHYKPSAEASRRDDNTFTIDEAAVALACFSGRTDLVVTVKKGTGKIFDRNGPIYPTLFSDTTNAIRVCRAVRVYRLLDHAITTREIGPEKLFYRHLRYFILHVLARRSGVIRKPELAISAGDREALSRELDDLGALIFTESRTFVIMKGYLALSRNLTDSTQLAQRVMAALVARDAAAAPVAEGTTVTPSPPAATEGAL